MAQTATWTNRITGVGEEPADQLLGNPRNFRIHSMFQQDVVKGSLDELGWIKRVTVNQRTGFVVDGHLRVKLAARYGQIVPVEYVDLSDEEEALALAVIDPTAALAGQDDGLLRDLMDEVQTDNEHILAMLAQMLGDEPEITEGLTDPDAVPEPLIEPTTKPGDLWRLGRHRLLCGDSTVVTDVERLMGGEKADMVFTDPPYGVSYVGKTKDALTIQNDDMPDDEFEAWLRDVFSLMASVMHDGCAYYVCCPAGNKHRLFWNSLQDVALPVRQGLVWLKQSMVLGHSDYHYKHEPMLYGWKAGAHYFTDDRTQVSVWEIDRPSRSSDHPTSKPTDLIKKALQNSSKPDAVVYEPFGGSGSTLIACEETGRQCRVMELDPKYCDVIIRRWEDFTGLHAELIRDEEAAA
jgi:DNA modification methylase